MDKIFSIMRRLHLYASFVIASFLLMYFLTGAVMIMGKVFPRVNKLNITENVSLKPGQSVDEAVAEIVANYGISGTITRAERSNGFSINYFRPAFRAEVNFNEKEGRFRVNVREATFWAALNDFHRLVGFNGWIRKIWAFFYDASCIALIIFAISGVYLWWKLEKRKMPGLVIFFLSSGITVFTIWYLAAVG